MGSHVVDFNSDGFKDIVVGTYDGSPHVSFGSAKGFKEPEHILDAKGKRILFKQFWEYLEDGSGAWRNTGEDHCISAVAFDWDNDDDFDLLLGSYDGKLFRQMNEGKKGEPSFTGINIPVKAGDKPLLNEGGMTAPRLVDWNGDGLMDLVCGSFGKLTGGDSGGGVYWYRNIGKSGVPRFASAVTLIPPGNQKSTSAVRADEGLYVDAADFNGDGVLDLIVGGYSHWIPLTRKLTPDEQARIDELDGQVKGSTQALNAMMDKGNGLSQKELQAFYDKLFNSTEYKELNKKMTDARMELNQLRPRPKREPGVWLYLGKKR
ncbi:MAG: VCBS repeat-containing protein [Planctomycetes bacterium]|nr:VCBS repeat-containing protein [Planctomycetota bacterium]